MIGSQSVFRTAVIAVAWLSLTAMSMAYADDRPRQPHLGFDGDLVKLPKKFDEMFDGNLIGMKVNSVNRGSPAARMGLERGDIIINIDNWSFKSYDGYKAALRQASEKPSIVLINVRTNKLTRRSCNLPHIVDEGEHPDTFRLAIDLERDMRR